MKELCDSGCHQRGLRVISSCLCGSRSKVSTDELPSPPLPRIQRLPFCPAHLLILLEGFLNHAPTPKHTLHGTLNPTSPIAACHDASLKSSPSSASQTLSRSFIFLSLEQTPHTSIEYVVHPYGNGGMVQTLCSFLGVQRFFLVFIK